MSLPSRTCVFALAALALAGCKSEQPEPAKPAPVAEQAKAQPPVASAPEKRVFFVYPQAGSTVFSTFDVTFGIEGMGVRPAGEDAMDKTTGHHHIIIDGRPVPAGEVVPKDENHLHYGGGQTSAEVTLSPGHHSLTMQFADGAHISYGPELAHTLGVTAVEGGEGRRVFFASLEDGAKVKSPLTLSFGLEGMKVRPAGEDVLDKTTGHHHLIIDGAAEPLGTVVPADATHIHYGKGQTEAEITLSPGKHTLTLQLADGAHLSYGPRLSSTLTVEVEP